MPEIIMPDPDGEPELPAASELDLAEEWDSFITRQAAPGIHIWNMDQRKTEFLAYLRELVSDPDAIGGIQFCDGCDIPQWSEDLDRANSADHICESCWSDWEECSRCEDRFPDSEVSSLLGGGGVCESCCDNHCFYCEECDGYDWNDNAAEHGHGSDYDGCCESPQPAFSIRNDGSGLLANDTRITVTLPAGAIDDEGLLAIRDYLLSQGREAGMTIRRVAYDLDELGNLWQTRSGNYTKRLSGRAFKEHKLKLPPEILSQVGSIARDHSNPVDVAIEVTRNLNLPPEDFCNEDSCWWNSYGESRCAAKTSGVFGLRTFTEWDGVSGRAWVMPLKQGGRGLLVPTFDAVAPAAFIVFNGYGDLSGYAAPRIMAHLAGWTYRRTVFRCEPMYVNSDTGYLVAPEVTAQKYADKALILSVPRHSDLFDREQAELAVTAGKETDDVLA